LGYELTEYGKDDVWFSTPTNDIHFLYNDFERWAIDNVLIVVWIACHHGDPYKIIVTMSDAEELHDSRHLQQYEPDACIAPPLVDKC